MGECSLFCARLFTFTRAPPQGLPNTPPPGLPSSKALWVLDVHADGLGVVDRCLRRGAHLGRRFREQAATLRVAVAGGRAGARLALGASAQRERRGFRADAVRLRIGLEGMN